MQPKLWAQKAPEYVSEARMLGTSINPPSVNLSQVGFIIHNEDIYFGLNGIRDVGKTAARAIIKARSKTMFKDVENFIMRVDLRIVNTKVFSALIKAGAFDRMGYRRKELLDKTADIYDYAQTIVKAKERTIEIHNRIAEDNTTNDNITRRDELRLQLKSSERKRNPGPILTSDEFDELQTLEELKLRKRNPLKAIDVPTFPALERSKIIELTVFELIEQGDYIGCYLNRHPARLLWPDTDLLSSVEEGEYVNIGGVCTKRHDIKTKKGDGMSFMEISDGTGTAELICFPSAFTRLEKSNSLPLIGSLMKINAKVETLEPLKLILNRVERYGEINEL